MDTIVCGLCGKIRKSYFHFTVNDVPVHFCEKCWQGQRTNFIKLLQSGDPKARGIYKAVVSAVSGAIKGGKVQ